MPFGITTPTYSGERTESGGFLGRLQHDATSGTWKIVKRVQQSDGSWADEESEPFARPNVPFLLDIATFEYGWIKFQAPPDFKVVPLGQPAPERPAEMHKNDQGRMVSSYRVGFRCKVYGNRLFGDNDPYYFSNASDAVNTPMDELVQQCLEAREFRAGKAPLIAVTGRVKNEPKGKFAKASYSPVFEIKGWYDRPACLGEQTVFPPDAARPAAQTAKPAGNSAAQPQRQTTKAPPPPPADDDWGNAAQAQDDLNDSIPF